MKKTFILLVALFFSSTCFCQDTLLNYYQKLILPETILKHLEVLADDSLEGRETGEPGMIKASEYISGEFVAYGIKPITGNSYFQDVPFIIDGGSAISITTEKDTFFSGKDYYSTDLYAMSKTIQSEIVFVGYGIVDSVSGWDDYKNLDVKNKIVLILDGEPKSKNGSRLMDQSTNGTDWLTDRKRKIQIARDKNVKAILFVNRQLNFNSERMNRWAKKGKYQLLDEYNSVDQPVVHITSKMANQILQEKNINIKEFEGHIYKKKQRNKYNKYSGEPITINYNPKFKNCRNVLGYIEGGDKKDEFIVLSAHLDHLGMNGDDIYNGADDDGSGCSTLLTIADIFAEAVTDGNRPRRSILFIFFTGEEKGLLGSEYYVKNPLVSLDNTIADLNVDMIGRVDTFSRDSKYYTYIIGSDRMSTELHNINESANMNCCNLELDYKYNDPTHKLKLYERSDHYNFVKHNVPVIFYFTGLHEDYHKPSDTIDKVDTEKTAVIARLIFNTAWELANRKERIKIDKAN